MDNLIFHKIFFIRFLLIFTGTLFLSSCDKDPVAPVPQGIGYFPLKKGNYFIYNVQEYFGFNELGLEDTSIYQLLEIQTDSFTDLEGNIQYRLERYSRPSPDSSWGRIDSVWSASRNNFGAIRTENQRRILKLIFPVEEGIKWNPNAYNELPPDSTKYGKTGIQRTVGSNSFLKTVEVIHENNTNLVSQNINKEYYAEGVGLIYKKYIDLEFIDVNPDTNIKQGIKYYQELVEFGNR